MWHPSCFVGIEFLFRIYVSFSAFLRKHIDICQTVESATAHLQAIGGKHEEVHQVKLKDSHKKSDKQRESTVQIHI